MKTAQRRCKDSLGSVVGLFDKAGAYLGGYSYFPYGETRSTGTNTAVSTNNNLRYIAGYYDTASGLYKLGARHYEPSLGRCTQYDPSGQEPGPYAYADGNPVNASDTTGLATAQSISQGIAIGAVTGMVGGCIAGAITAAFISAGVGAGFGCLVGAVAEGYAGAAVGGINAALN